jgi:hypothetical protein
VTDPSFQGIDPQLLSQLTSSLTKGASTGSEMTGGYVGQFSRLGLDTGAVNKLLSDYDWAQSQQGMLQRRLALASHQPSGQWVNGMATAGAGTLAYPTAAAAKKAGGDEGKKLSALIAANDWSGVQAELKTLKGNDDDPDYMAALFTALGPSAIYYLSADYNTLKESGHQSEADELQNVIGQGLATASSEFPLTGKYLEGIQSRESELDYYPGGDIQALGTFLTVGTYSTQWLTKLTPYALLQAPGAGGDFPRPGTDQIFQAIANNPAYAAQLFSQEMTGPDANRFARFLADPLYVAQISNKPGFAAFVKAATIPPPGAASASLYSGNAKSLIEMFGEDPGDRTSGAIRQDMVGITTFYWNDMYASVTAAAPDADKNKYVGLGIPMKDWGYFVQEAMRDPKSAAQLLTFYSEWQLHQPGANAPQQEWQNASQALMSAFVQYNYIQAGESAGNNSEAIASVLAEAGSAAFGAIVFPEGEAAVGGVALLKSAFDEAYHEGAKSFVSNAIENAVGNALEPGENPNVDAGAQGLTVAGKWSLRATQTYNNNAAGAAPFLKANNPYTWQDPSYYEQKYHGDFIQGGKIMTGPMNDEQLAAFNAWLQDPGVAKVIGPQVVGGETGAEALAWEYLQQTMSSKGDG